MAEPSSDEKTEKPSPQKLRKAREDGQIPRSKDMSLAATLFAAWVVLGNSFPLYQGFIRDDFITVHQLAGQVADPQVIGQFLLHNLLILSKFILTLLPLPLAAILASLLPGGWVFQPHKLLPDFSKISPLKGIGRLFASDHVVDIGKMALKSLATLGLIAMTLRSNFDSFVGLQQESFHSAVFNGLSLYQSVMLNLVMLFIFFALVDVPLMRHQFMKGLRMTKQEQKEEHRNQEGKPEVKARIRRIQRQMAMGQIRKVVPQADVVLTNPTHYAVALKYDTARAPAPFVVARGKDEVALYIRQVAAEHHIEVVEYPVLARSVYFTTQINQQIPTQLYRAIAHILTYVLQLRHWREGKQPRPILNRQIAIPKEVLKRHADD